MMTAKQIRLYEEYHNSSDVEHRYAIAREIIESKKKHPIKYHWDNTDLRSMKGETWKPICIPGFEKHFVCSSFGRLKRLFRIVGYRNGNPKRWETAILKPNKLKGNVLRFTLYVNNKRMRTQAYRITALSFIPNPQNKPTVNHIDGDRLNAHFLNLEWATWSENILHAFRVLGRKPVVLPTELCSAYKGEISQYSVSGELIKKFKSRTEAAANGFIPEYINRVIRGEKKKYKGFVWKQN